MSSDGLCPITFEELRRKLESLGFSDDPLAWDGPTDTRTFFKDMMGLGTPYYYTVAYKGDNVVIRVPTLRKLIAALGVPAAAFLEA
jgi:hypothetical protein